MSRTNDRSDWWHPQWLIRPPTEDESRWITEWMTTHNSHSGEVLQQWKVIDDMLRAAGYESHPGGGPENDDLVRGLIARCERTERIAQAHYKRVDEHGGTWGECAECGLQHPCPTYVWAASDSTRDSLMTWNPSDDEVVSDEQD